MNRINPYKSFTGAWIPNWLLERQEISLGAKVVYARLCQFAGEKGYAHPKLSELTNAIGTPLSSLQRYLTELRVNNLIEIVLKREEMAASEYYFLEHEWMRPLTPKWGEPHLKLTGASPQNEVGDIKDKIHKRESNIYSEEFETFWKAYPNKTSKMAAWMQWCKVKPPLDKILQALEWQVETKKWKGGYVLDPERYIKRHCWEDEPEEIVCPLPDLGFYR